MTVPTSARWRRHPRRSALGEQLVLAEYAAIRDESRQALEAQQATLNWSLAGLAALFGGGVVYATAALQGGHPHPVTAAMFFLIFDVVIPGFAFASVVTYVGEIERMERAGRYLRGLELAVAGEQAVGRAPLHWERFLVQARSRQTGRRSPRRGKSPVPYAGGFMLYCGGMLASWAFGAVLWVDGSYATALRTSLSLDSQAAAVLVGVGMSGAAAFVLGAIYWVFAHARRLLRGIEEDVDIELVDRSLVIAASARAARGATVQRVGRRSR